MHTIKFFPYALILLILCNKIQCDSVLTYKIYLVVK